MQAYSQSPKAGDIIELSNTVLVNEDSTQVVALDKTNDSKRLQFLDPGVKFRVVKIDKSTVQLRALNYKPLSETAKENLTKNGEIIKSEYYNDKLYTISLQDFVAYAEAVEEYDKLSVGLITLPFKARPQGDFTFDTEFNISSTVNIKIWEFWNTSFNIQAGAGIGSVGLNASNATGLSDSEAQDVSVLTFFAGGMFQYKKVQVGFYAGVDQLNNQAHFGWESNGNLWLGFGVGYNLFQISASEASNKQK